MYIIAVRLLKVACYVLLFFFFKQKTAYEMLRSLVGSEMCIRDRPKFVQLGIQAAESMRPQLAALADASPQFAQYEKLSLIHI